MAYDGWPLKAVFWARHANLATPIAKQPEPQLNVGPQKQ